MRTSLHLSPSVRLLGARQSLLQLVTHLDPQRWRPVVALPFSRGGLADALDQAGVAHETVRMGQWRKVKFWPRIPFDLRRLRRIARAEGVDLIHVNEPHSAPYGLRVARALGIPCIGHVRLDNVDQRLIRNYGLAQLDAVVAVSHAVADQLRGLPSVHVIPNGVDGEALRQVAPPRDRARARLGLGADDLVIGQVGLITPRKRCHVAIEAFELIAEQFPSARLLLVGDPGPSDAGYRDEIERRITQRDLGRHVRLLPFQEDIAAVYAALDVNLLISGTEGFGRVIIEAAALGIPTIGTRVGGIPEVIREGETGLLIPPDDPTALAEALVALLSNAGGRRRMGEVAQRWADAENGIDRHTERMMALFDQVLATQRAVN
ncbi:glycosyltransferase family 4 protein [Candidatus Sumerlaeota bacterium]|nr:glycosyltransferase family 4 protein [Candidatus Sumerlaeota bacterium]